MNQQQLREPEHGGLDERHDKNRQDHLSDNRPVGKNAGNGLSVILQSNRLQNERDGNQGIEGIVTQHTDYGSVISMHFRADNDCREEQQGRTRLQNADQFEPHHPPQDALDKRLKNKQRKKQSDYSEIEDNVIRFESEDQQGFRQKQQNKSDDDANEQGEKKQNKQFEPGIPRRFRIDSEFGAERREIERAYAQDHIQGIPNKRKLSEFRFRQYVRAIERTQYQNQLG